MREYLKRYERVCQSEHAAQFIDYFLLKISEHTNWTEYDYKETSNAAKRFFCVDPMCNKSRTGISHKELGEASWTISSFGKPNKCGSAKRCPDHDMGVTANLTKRAEQSWNGFFEKLFCEEVSKRLVDVFTVKEIIAKSSDNNHAQKIANSLNGNPPPPSEEKDQPIRKGKQSAANDGFDANLQYEDASKIKRDGPFDNPMNRYFQRNGSTGPNGPGVYQVTHIVDRNKIQWYMHKKKGGKDAKFKKETTDTIFNPKYYTEVRKTGPNEFNPLRRRRLPERTADGLPP